MSKPSIFVKYEDGSEETFTTWSNYEFKEGWLILYDEDTKGPLKDRSRTGLRVRTGLSIPAARIKSVGFIESKEVAWPPVR